FYIYNLLFLLTFLVLYGLFRERLLRLTMHAMAAALFLQVLLSPVSIDRSELRQQLFFNDPNQLGYYAVLAATVFLMGARFFRAPLASQACVFAAAAYLAILSLSKSALFSLLLLSVLLLARSPVRLLVGGLLLVVAILGALSMPPRMAPPIVANFQKRMLNEGTDETPEKRGYDRIVNHPYHLLLGAGEGATYRFQSQWPGELHSSWGTLLFSYGLVGFSLFAWGLWRLLRPDLHVAIYLMPAALYGFIQHGLRFTSFWTVLAF